MQLSILIVSYNTRNLTIQTVQSVISEVESSVLLRGKTEIFVIDNASSDDTLEQLKPFQEKTPYLKVIENSENLGFAQANNLGITKSKGKYVLFLNSDTIVQPKSLERLVEIFEISPIDDTTSALSTESDRLDRLGILSPLLVNSDGTEQSQGGNFPSLWSIFFHMTMLDDLPVVGQFLPSTQRSQNLLDYSEDPNAKVHQQDWISGAAMMVRRATLEEIGPLDQNIFMYGEDVEFCLRAKNHQWDVGILPNAVVTHLGSASSSSVNAIVGEMKGYVYIWSKHKPVWQMKYLKFLLKLGCRLRIFLFGRIMNKPEKTVPYTTVLKSTL